MWDLILFVWERGGREAVALFYLGGFGVIAYAWNVGPKI